VIGALIGGFVWQVVNLAALCGYGFFDDALKPLLTQVRYSTESCFTPRASLKTYGGYRVGCCVVHQSTLNDFMAAGKKAWRAVRGRLIELFSADCGELRDNAEARTSSMFPMASVTMVLPASIGDYTDFYSSREHATNVGTMFRGKDNALQPNWCDRHIRSGGTAHLFHLVAHAMYVSHTVVCLQAAPPCWLPRPCVFRGC